MKKILVVRYRFIGDMILTIPFLRNLRNAYPDAQIDMLVAPNSGEVIESCPYVNHFIYFDTATNHKYEQGKGDVKSFFHYVSVLKKGKYDKAYILKRSFSSALLCFLAGIKERIGYDTEHRGFLLTKKVQYDMKKHEALCMLDVLSADGIQIKDKYLENWVPEDNTNKVKRFLLKNGINDSDRIVIVNAMASNEDKMWGFLNFSQIIEYLINEKNVKVIFLGSAADAELYDKKMKYKEPLKNPPMNLCGKFGMRDSLAIIKEADFVIGNDTGTLHMAASVGTRVIGLYGPMPFEKWRAIGKNNILLKANLDCMPCSLKQKCPKDRACLKAITVKTVKEAVDKMLSI